MNIHERKLIQSFFVFEKRDRYLSLISSPKGRIKFRRSLAHFKDVDLKYLISIPGQFQNDKDIESLLQNKGAPAMCHVISENSKIDGGTLPLAEALSSVVGMGFSTFLSCIPGELVYYESGEVSSRFLCQRPALKAGND